VSDYLFWQKRRRKDAAAWHWRFPAPPPPDVAAEAPPPGRTAIGDPRRERRAGFSAYEIAATFVGVGDLPQELRRDVLVIPRRERYAASDAYRIAATFTGADVVELDTPPGRVLLVVPRRDVRGSATAYGLIALPIPAEAAIELPLELRQTIDARRLFLPRSSTGAYWLWPLFTGADVAELPDELRRFLLDTPRSAPRAAKEAYSIPVTFGGVGDLPEELRRGLAELPRGLARAAAEAYAAYHVTVPPELLVELPIELRRAIDERRLSLLPRAIAEAYRIPFIAIGPDAALVKPLELTFRDRSLTLTFKKRRVDLSFNTRSTNLTLPDKRE